MRGFFCDFVDEGNFFVRNQRKWTNITEGSMHNLETDKTNSLVTNYFC